MRIHLSSYLLSKLKPTGFSSASIHPLLLPLISQYHSDRFSQPSCFQSSSMPASSRKPTGLPRTPGNPGKPWRGWKTEGKGGQVGREQFRNRGKHRKGSGQRWDTYEVREEDREWGVSCTAAKGYFLRSLKPRPKEGKRELHRLSACSQPSH